MTSIGGLLRRLERLERTSGPELEAVRIVWGERGPGAYVRALVGQRGEVVRRGEAESVIDFEARVLREFPSDDWFVFSRSES